MSTILKHFILSSLLLLFVACAVPPPVPVPTVAPAAITVEAEATIPPGDDTQSPPPVTDSANVPAATLQTSAGTTQAAIPGTRCWGSGCVDMVGILAPTEPLMVAPGEVLTFTLTAGDPSSLHLDVLGWEPSTFEGEPGITIIARDASLVESGNLEPTRTIVWEAPSQPGDYALSLFSSYQQGGDIAYGWHIVIR